ncbi:putative indole-3-acetic acid-amido synthetase GH3.9 isoform X1 [Nicotiana sylvestris]|uniref:putative indole-3-acetic acid-amido synthetase GH3.9 isoform X1 n=1 Tax=Nicotiana sylvestris TaxID=4096 RepID=UPI00388CAA2B
MDGKKLEYKGKEAMKEIERLTKNADEVQEGILREILSQNGETEYLKKFIGSKDNKQVSKFKSLVPAVTYEDIQPYILRIANGEDPILISANPITEMLCSSGTSGGEPKLMPSIAQDLDRRTFLYNLIMPIMNQYIPGLDEGLYRYRIGDVLQVTGFHNKAPQFRFICRRNVVLSIDNDKTNEKDLHRSITLAKKLLEPHQALLVEYTSYADASSVPGHYVLYWEIVHSHSIVNKDVNVEAQVVEECCIAIEEELDYIYRRCRTNDKSIGPLEIRLVKPGTFEALMDLLISQGGSINQYKTPRCIISNDSALQLLNSNVKASYFSPREPSWKASSS